jgi:hypothetical protein
MKKRRSDWLKIHKVRKFLITYEFLDSSSEYSKKEIVMRTSSHLIDINALSNYIKKSTSIRTLVILSCVEIPLNTKE